MAYGRCRLCTYFRRINRATTRDGEGRCYRYAPRPEKGGLAVWSMVMATDGCGDFAPIVEGEDTADRDPVRRLAETEPVTR